MKSRFSIKIMVAAILIVSLTSTPSFALFGRVAGKAVKEAVEYTAKKFGIELGQEGGKQFAKKASQFIATHGDQGMRALKNVGPDVMELTARHGKDVVRMCAATADDAALYLARNIDNALPIWREFGKKGTDLMIKHPGLAKPLLDQFGKKGLRVGKKLSSEDLGKFLTLSSKAATKKGKDILLDKVLKEGDKVLEFLWRHKWKLAAGATLYTLLKDYENGSETIETSPDGKTIKKTGSRTSILERLFIWTLNKTLDNYPWLPLVCLLLILIWLVKPLLEALWAVLAGIRRVFQKLRARQKQSKVTAGLSVNTS